MSENHATYRVSAKKRLTANALKRRACCKPYSDERYRAPSADEITALIENTGWTQQQFAQVVGVSTSSGGSSTIRRWKSEEGSESYRAMPYAAWRLALLESGLILPGNSH
jgi:DNA-binding transcriptional regulator YiaG